MSENVVHLHKPTDPPAVDTAPTVLTVVPDVSRRGQCRCGCAPATPSSA